MAACCCHLGTSGRMTGKDSMLTLTSLEPSISMSPKLYRHQPHSKVPSAFRTKCGHCLSFSGCSGVSGLPPESKNKGSEGVLGSPVATRIVAVTVTALSVPACFCPQTCCSVFLGSTVGSASTRGRGWSHTPSPWSSSATMPSKVLRLPSSVGDLALSICFSDQHGPRLPIKMSVFYMPKNCI